MLFKGREDGKQDLVIEFYYWDFTFLIFILFVGDFNEK